MAKVAIHEFIFEDGTPTGCGTALELQHWTDQGVFEGVVLGKVIGYEPAICDRKRAAQWGLAA
jgi:hypothetical protein